jgi:pimeloyl-ACP methyl ester carboxylesterase
MDANETHLFLTINHIRLHVVTVGPEDGRPVVLLHGFPEYWRGWKNQMIPLAAAGYRVILPDQRGYNLSDKPAGLSAYRMDQLASDVKELIAAFGYERAAVIGHDWGGVVAWVTAALYPRYVERLVAMDAPYVKVAFSQIWRHPEQLLKSYYMGFFQLPGIPEKSLSRERYAALVRSMQKTSPPGTFSEDDFEGYREAWGQEGALTSMLNWYRALFRQPVSLPERPVFSMPVLILWGGRDFALGRELAEASLKLCENGKLIVLDEANHWVQHEKPEAVNRLVLDFLKEQPAL